MLQPIKHDPISRGHKSALQKEVVKGDWWNKVFIPEFQKMYENLDILAFSTYDPYKRSMYLEGQKTLATLMSTLQNLEKCGVQENDSEVPQEKLT